MKRTLSHFTLTLLFIGASPAFCDNIFSDNFDFGQSIQTPLGTGVVDPYLQNDNTVNQSTFAVFGSPNNGSVPSCPTGESGNCLNLAGGYDVSQIVTRSPLTLTPGMYDLTFQFAGSQRAQDLNSLDSARVSFGNVFSKSFSVAPMGGTQDFDLKFTVNSPTTANLVFTDTTARPANDDFDDGVILDNIHVSTASAVTTPEPATVALTAGAGLLLIAGGLRRRRSAQRIK